MSLQDTIKQDTVAAMKSRDTLRTTVLRSISAAFVNELVSKREKPDGALSDDDAIAVMRREAKKRQDAVEQFRAGRRSDLAEKEHAELAIITEYLPQMMNEDAIREIALAKKNELGVADSSQRGVLMSALMKDLKGKADGSLVKKVVDNILK